ncbi:MAG: hypothetical protein K6G16_09520 [Lachnospiraceae bacterium]|nr:hypothetical protein [Lachnospiraceae bacterium]
MTIERMEEMFRQADFSAGSPLKEELRKRLFGAGGARARIVSMPGALSDDDLSMVSAAGVDQPAKKERRPETI